MKTAVAFGRSTFFEYMFKLLEPDASKGLHGRKEHISANNGEGEYTKSIDESWDLKVQC